MSELLPIIEDLANACDDRERVVWLATCPIAVLVTYQTTIRNRLRMARFLAGVDYLDAVLVAMRAARRRGDTDMTIALAEARDRLVAAGGGNAP